MNRKDVLFTFDYELYLGKHSGGVEKCMISPTYKVCEVLEYFGIRGVFFVDCTYLSQLEKRSESNSRIASDFEKINKQICRLLEAGHYVYPHIHPHWLDATYIEQNNTWSLSDLSKYRFHSLNTEQKTLVFNESLDAFSRIIEKKYPAYRIEAFRAGGWCIQPFDDFMPFFYSRKIIADFSVLGGAKKENNALVFDFTSVAPNAKPYYFHDNPCQPVHGGSFIEFPISGVRNKKPNKVEYLFQAAIYRTKYGKSMGDGNGVVFLEKNKTQQAQETEMASIELMNLFNYTTYKDFIDSNSFMHFVSHPKMLSQHNLDMLHNFLEYIQEKYIVNSNWKEIPLP